jgi:CDGSH-type Zn-finger protein
MIPIHDGPLIVRGRLRMLDPESGGVIAEETRLALCRCGKSENQPFCDNSHRRTHFDEPAPEPSADRAEATSPADVCPPQDFVLH